MKILTSIRLWLLLVLLYTASSLWVLDRRATRDAPASDGPAFVLTADPQRQPQAIVLAESPNQAAFEISFKASEMEQAAQLRVFLKPSRAFSSCTVQILAEGDHRESFSHLYRLPRLPNTGFAFTVPLLNDAFYWRTVGHTGAWTHWDRCGLRRLQVKFFATVPLSAGDLELSYLMDSATEKELVLTSCHVQNETLTLGQRQEIVFDLAGWNGNPFDYQELPVVAEVVDPAGHQVQLLPFLHQEFTAVNRVDGERIRPAGPKHLRVRFRPAVAGEHLYRLLLRGTTGTNSLLHEGRFAVLPGAAPPFLRVSLRAPHFFERTDGSFVYLLGWNLPYPVDRPYGSAYAPYLPKENSLTFARKLVDDIADCGGNFMNYWLSDWWNGLEWNRSVDQYGGIGRYNLKNAWINDQVVKYAETRGVYMQWETMNHVRLSRSYGWFQHPYSRRNGGFLRRPEEYWTHTETLRLSENRLSYIVARYADSPAIHSWNVMSEPDMVSAYVWPQAKAYLRAQTAFIRDLDPYKHIVSTHICLPDHDVALFAEPLFQFVNSNAYPGLAGLHENQIEAIRDYSVRYAGHGKPVMVAETGGHWGGDPPFKMRRDTVGALWAGIASELAGSPSSWWWNFNYGEDLGQRYYRVAADFMKGEDLIAADASAGGNWVNRAVEVESREGNARALGVGNGTRRFLFLYNFDTLSRTRLIPSTCADLRVTCREMMPGTYRAEYWDLKKGRSTTTETVAVEADGIVKLNPPEFTKGWAVKLLPLDAAVAPPPPVAATVAPAATHATPGRAEEWSWRLEPLAGIVHSNAVARSMIDVRLALPDACRSRCPAVTDEAGRPVPFAWESLDAGLGWSLKIPAAGVLGPLVVTAVKDPPPTVAVDEAAFGLELTVVRGSRAWVGVRADFVREFDRQATQRKTRVACVDQLENPLGDTSSFLAVYAGPLFIPADGVYEFASNSDDASFVLIDGQEIVAWPGQHDMEIVNRPNANAWRHRAQLQLSHGLHWVEYNHQQRGGGCLARLGWRMPENAWTNDEWIARPYADTHVPEMDVVPEWALDGRIPCRISISFQGSVRLVQDPSFGLELRRPDTRIATAALRSQKGRDFRFFLNEGPQWIEEGGLSVPLWGRNDHVRRFSLEWEACVDSRRQRGIKALLYDIDLPLSMQFGRDRAVEKSLMRQQWAAWFPPVGDAAVPFVLHFDKVPLVRGVLAGEGAQP